MVGLGLIGAGTWFINPPAALIAVGAILVITTVAGAVLSRS